MKIVPSLSGRLVAAFLGISSLAAQTTNTVNTTTLSSYDNVHPKLLLDTAKFNSIRSAIVSPPAGTRWADMWLDFKAVADAAAAKLPLEYTTPGASDEQLWQREVGDTLGILSMAYVLTKTTPPAVDTIWMEAEDVPVTAPMAVFTEPTVSGGKYIATPIGGAVNNPNTQPPSATYAFSTVRTANYHLWLRVYSADANSNTAWLTVNGAQISFTSSTPHGSWKWVYCGSWNLSPGTHSFSLTYQKQGLCIDKLVFSSDPNLAPSGLGIEQRWVEAEDFQLNSTGTGANPNNLIVKTTSGLMPFGDSLAHGRKWLESWSGIPANNTLPAATAVPDAQKTLALTGGSYDVWVRFKAPYKGHDTFYFAVDTLGYSQIALDGTSVFPYNSLVPVSQLTYNKTLSAPNNSYAYREWVWRKVASNCSLAAGDHTFKISNRDSSGGANPAIDRILVMPAGSAAPPEPNKYLAAAQQWARNSCSYPTWGTGDYGGDGLAAAHQLVGLSLLYDWCANVLGGMDRLMLKNTLGTRGADMYNGIPTAWWRDNYLQNHLWTDMNALTFAAVAIHGESGAPDTLPWAQAAMDKLGMTMYCLGSDGVDHEGAGYWCAVDHLLKYMDVSRKILGVDFFSTPWFGETADYRLYFDLPRNGQTGSQTHINFADSLGYDWAGPNYILRKLAGEYNIPTAQWQAAEYDVKKINYSNNVTYNTGTSPWLNLVWYNPAIPENSPTAEGLSTFGYFDDLDFAVMRSGWDGDESVVAYQCGPFLGHGVEAKNTTNYVNWGGNHVHPAASNFCIFGSGEWLLQNAGYTYKMTAYTNSLLISGAGQLGEGDFTFNSKPASAADPNGTLNPAIDNDLSFTSAQLDYVVGNATACYPTSTGLTKFRRHLLFLKPDVLVVVDDIALSAPKPLELRFFPKQQTITQQGNIFKTQGPKAKLDFTVLQIPAQVQSSTKTVPVTLNTGGTSNRTAYSLATTSDLASMSSAVAFSWSPNANSPRAVTFVADADGSAWKFKAGNQTIVLNRGDDSVRLLTCLDAEGGTLNAPMEIYSDEPQAGGGQYVAAKAGTVTNNPDTLTSPSAQYTFSVPAAGNYAVWARVKAADGGTHSFYFALNPGAGTAYTLKSTYPNYGSWVWLKLNGAAALSAGNNVLAIHYRQALCKIDQFLVTDDSAFVPSGSY